MADLCVLNDVAAALGLPNAAAMSASQQARAVPLIAQVSRLFASEAQRPFAPGTSTARLRVLSGGVRCPEPVTSVTSVVTDDGVTLTGYTIKGHYVLLAGLRTPWSEEYSFGALRTPAPDFVTVTYVHSEAVPPAVVGAVGSIVARYLRIDPAVLGAGAGVAEDLTAGDYRMRLSEWTTRNVSLSPEDCELARGYRHPSPSAVIGT